MNYVYGNSRRIFVNMAIGCNSSCGYCYLKKIKSETEVIYATADEIIEIIENTSYFVKGQEGTIVSLGCYSECISKENLSNTIKILEFFLEKGNYIQLSTKQVIPEQIRNIIISKRKYAEQVTIYISMPTISSIPDIEKQTASFTERVNNIIQCNQDGICIVLYIKPFLNNITSKDVEKYKSIIVKYNIPVVVGGYISTEKKEIVADVGENLLYEQDVSDECIKFIENLNEVTDVYQHSTEIIEQYKRRKLND